jgi:uncharacterized protein (TIGR02145 family)
VDNTSDASKPVSTATQTALNEKAPKNNPEFTGQVYGIDKSMVGLDRVDNTSDEDKRVSIPTQMALDLKLNKSAFPSGNRRGEFMYWNGDAWTTLPPGERGESIIIDQNGNPTWGCLIPSSAALPSTTPTIAVNKPMTPITIATTGVTGILVQVLPQGLQASWDANVITISGTPTQAYPFQYLFVLSVNCGQPLEAKGTIVVTPATAPDAPTGVVATAGDGSASVAFVAPSNDGGSDIWGYRVESNPPFTFFPGNGSGPTSPIIVSGLTNGTAYTFTVVAWNDVGPSEPTAPSAAVTPAPPPSACPTTTVEDRDQNVYNTVGIGTQCWMAENLRVRKYNDGTDIRFDKSGGSVGNTSQTWAGTGLEYGAYTLYAHDSVSTPSNLSNYGYLYNWYAVKGIFTTGVIASTDTLNICPTGWHVPTDAEWVTLTDYLGAGTAGTLMKKNDALWSTNSGTNSSGFSALPGGIRLLNGGFSRVRNGAFFWSATEDDFFNALTRDLGISYGYVSSSSASKSVGASVRCLRD